MNLKDKIFLLDPASPLNRHIAENLENIVAEISGIYPDCSIILGGSLSYGEGKTKVLESGQQVLVSDTDIFLVFPSLIESFRAKRNIKISSFSNQANALKSVEYIIVWEGALKLKLTTIAGELLKESGTIRSTLNSMRPPEPINNLKRAYKFLIKAISSDSDSDEFFRKSSIQAFQAFLLATESNSGYEEWKNFYSLKYCLKKIEKYADSLDSSCAGLIKEAISSLLSGSITESKLRHDDYLILRRFLQQTRDNTNIGFRLNDYLRFLSHHLRRDKLINPFVNSTVLFFKTADRILELFDNPDRQTKSVLRSFYKLTGEKLYPKADINELIGKMADGLLQYDKAYLHKVSETA